MACVRELGTECEAIPSKLRSTFKQDTTHSGTHSAVNSNDETHDKVAQDTGTDCHSPTEANGDHRRSCIEVSAPPHSRKSIDNACRGGLTNFPVRDGPGVGHPVGDIGAPAPSALGRRNGVEIGIGGSLGGSKAALLLTDLKAETGQASLGAGHVTDFDRLDGGRGWGATLLVVEGFVIVGCHGGWWYMIVASQCGRHVEGREEKEAISNLSYIVEVEGTRQEKARPFSRA